MPVLNSILDSLFAITLYPVVNTREINPMYVRAGVAGKNTES